MSTKSTPGRPQLSLPELRARFRELTRLMYTTNVPLATLAEQVYPYLAPGIEFVDPWIRARGLGKFKNGLRGFHCAFLFDFDIHQLEVTMNERGDGGRVIVDGVMNLQTLRFYSYPLRTILTYEFVLTDGAHSLAITRLEEMWSYADMIRNLPVVGAAYEGFRHAAALFFTGFFWASCAIAQRFPWARQYPGKVVAPASATPATHGPALSERH